MRCRLPRPAVLHTCSTERGVALDPLTVTHGAGAATHDGSQRAQQCRRRVAPMAPSSCLTACMATTRWEKTSAGVKSASRNDDGRRGVTRRRTEATRVHERRSGSDRDSRVGTFMVSKCDSWNPMSDDFAAIVIPCCTVPLGLDVHRELACSEVRRCGERADDGRLPNGGVLEARQ
jgi:hypothetical protein